MKFNPSHLSYGSGGPPGSWNYVPPPKPMGTSAPGNSPSKLTVGGVSAQEAQKAEKEAKLDELKDKLKSTFKYSVITVPVAWVLSYKRNQSIWWAFLSGIIATPYIIYRGAEYVIDKDKK